MIYVMATDPRVKQVNDALDKAERSAAWLADKLGVSRQSVSDWLGERSIPKDETVWGKMLGILEAPLSPPSNLIFYEPQMIRYAGVVPAGDWGDPLASEEFVGVDPELFKSNRFAASVVGISCYPALHPGDFTVWEADHSPPFGHVVIAQRKGDHGCTVKELVWDEEGRRPRLLPINPDCDEPDDGDGWGVTARIVAAIRKVEGNKHMIYNPDGLTVRALNRL